MNRLHPLSAVTYALQYGFLFLWIPVVLVIGLASATGVSTSWLALAAPVGFILGVTYGIVYYYRFEYVVTETTVDVASGVFARRSREIPYRRIQNVDVRQSVFQRLLDLAVVSIETAGGGASEATLNFVSEDEANRLQRDIRRRTAEIKGRRQGSEPTPDETGSGDRSQTGPPESQPRRPPASDPFDGAPDRLGPQANDIDADSPPAGTGTRADEYDDFDQQEKPLFDLKSRELLLYSFTSFRPAAIAAAVFLFFLATDTIIGLFVTIAQPFGGPAELGEGTTQSHGILTVISAINGIIITYLISVAYTFGTYYGFQLGRIGEDFVYERGLLQRYSGSIPVEKVQAVTVTENPIQRLIDHAGLWVETAGYGPDSDGGSQSAVPLATTPRVHQFAENLTGVEPPQFRSPPTLARRRYLVRFSLVATVVVAIAFGVAQLTPIERWYLAAIVFAAVPPAAHLRYVNLGYYAGDNHLVIRRGFWRRHTTVIPYYRIQTVNTRRSIFQRRLGLASLVVDTASSRSFFWTTPTIYDVELEDAREVQGTSRKQLQVALRERARSTDPDMEVDFTHTDRSGGVR